MTSEPPPEREPGVLTGLPRSELASWLAEVRKVAALSGDAALGATDTLLWAWGEARDRLPARDGVPNPAEDAPETAQDARYALWMVTDDIARLREAIRRLRGAQAARRPIATWEAEALRRRADAVGQFAGAEAREAMAQDIERARAEAEALAGELEGRVS